MPFDVVGAHSSPLIYNDPLGEIYGLSAKQQLLQRSWVSNPIFYPSWMDEGFLFIATVPPAVLATSWEAIEDYHSQWIEQFALPAFILLADESSFVPPPPPPVAVSGEDDFAALSFLYPLFHGDDASGFVPLPPLVQPSAEEDFVLPLLGWNVYEDDTSGFAPLPPLAQPSAEDDQQFRSAQTGAFYEEEISGFTPAVVLFSGFSDDTSEQIFLYQGSLASMVDLIDIGFQLVVVGPGPSSTGRSARFGFSMPSFR